MPKAKSHKPSNPINPPSEAPASDQVGLDRLIFFSDSVFAIAATLLALEIRLPASAQSLTNDAQLLTNLLGIWQKFLGYLISFLVIGTFWIAHHRKFRYIKRYDSRLMMLNLLLLMVIAFIPFPSAIISEYSSRTGTIFYALTIILAGLLTLVVWNYAVRHEGFIDPHLDGKLRRREVTTPLITIGVFVLSIGISFIHPDLAKLSWLLLLPAVVYSNRGK